MNFNDAKNLITNVLNSQRLTIAEHTQIQQAWQCILKEAESADAPCGEQVNYGDDAVSVSGTIQQGQ